MKKIIITVFALGISLCTSAQDNVFNKNGNVEIKNNALKLKNYILFDADGDFTGGNYFTIQDDSQSNTLRFGYGLKNQLNLNANGNFGIGTVYAGARLDVISNDGQTENFANFRIADASGDYLKIFNGTGEAGRFSPTIYGHSQNFTNVALNLIGSTDASKDIVSSTPLVNFDARRNNGSIEKRVLFGWSSYGQRKMTMLANGNLGIGTLTPKEKLQIGNGFSFHDGGHKVLSFVYAPTGNTDLSSNAYAAEIRFDHTTGNLRLGTSKTVTSEPTTQMTITKDGKVGLGITNPTNRFTISSSENEAPSILVKNNSYDSNSNTGKVGLQFAFRNHEGPKIEAYKINKNRTALKFSTEYGYSTTQLGMVIKPYQDGAHVGIGTDKTDGFKLSIDGKVRANEVKVYTNWADYVFKEDYKLPTLAAVAKHIKEKGHLINIPSESEVKKNGIYLGKMNVKLLEKIEELTLYTLAQQKQLTQQEKKIKELQNAKTKIATLEKRLAKIEALLEK